MGYSEYPKSMIHPQYRPAVVSSYRKNPDGTTTNDAPGKPAQFPPVYVNNADQEAEYAAKGYIPSGTSDPEAYLRATIGASDPESFEFDEYPKWMYRKVDGELESKLVNSEAEETRLGSGWYGSPACDEGGEEEVSVRKKAGRPKKVVAAVQVGE